MKYHINQRVRIVGKSRRDSLEKMRADKNALDETKARIAVVCSDYYFVDDGDAYHIWEFNEADLAPYEITWETLEPGVMIEDEYDDVRRVIDVLPNSFLASDEMNLDITDDWYTIALAKENGWKIIQPAEEDIEELTVEEISKRLGKTIKVVKK